MVLEVGRRLVGGWARWCWSLWIAGRDRVGGTSGAERRTERVIGAKCVVGLEPAS